jgi:hypothetical protein
MFLCGAGRDCVEAVGWRRNGRLAFLEFTTTCPSMNNMFGRSFSTSKVTDNASTHELPKRWKPEV